MRWSRRLLLFLVLLPFLAGAAAAGHADDNGVEDLDDHDSAYKAVKGGDVLPLIDILRKARPEIGSEIVGVDYETSGGKPFYEIYFIDKTGHRREAYFDARTGDRVQRPPDD